MEEPQRRDMRRNVALIGHIDHGKTQLAEVLARYCCSRVKVTRPVGSTICSRLATYALTTDLSEDATARGDGSDPCLRLHLIDTPGHSDFTHEAAAGVRLADGALVVVDCMEGVCLQTKRMLKIALADRMKPVLVVSKIDRAIIEHRLQPEALYQRLARIVKAFNDIITQCQPSWMENTIKPQSVIFVSALHGWGFTIKGFSVISSIQTGLSPDVLEERLWGDHYYDQEAKQMCCLEGGAENQEVLVKYQKKYRFSIVGEEPELEGKLFMKTVMARFLPLAPGLINTIYKHLPSPSKAQVYRVELYKGPLNDEWADAIQACSDQGALVAYIAKMLIDPGNIKSRYALCRIFSGSMQTGDKIRYTVIRRILNAQGQDFEEIHQAAAGEVVYAAVSSSTISNPGDIFSNHRMKGFSSACCLPLPYTINIEPKCPTQLPQVADAMRTVGQICTAEAQLGDAIDELKKLAGVDVISSQPVTSLRETITSHSSLLCTSKSPNRRSTLSMIAEPLPAGMAADIEHGLLNVERSPERGLADEINARYLWNLEDATQVLDWGPHGKGSNALINQTTGVAHLRETVHGIRSAFQYESANGVLCDEPLHGVRFNLVDAAFTSQAMFRGYGQIIPTARRAMRAAMLSAEPRIMEPFHLVELHMEESVPDAARSVRAKPRFSREGTTMHKGLPLRAPVLADFHDGS